MVSTGQSCLHSADSSRERGRSGRTPWSASASLQFVFHLRGKTCAGCEHVPTQLQPQPGPFPAPRPGTLIPAYTNSPRAKHWPWASAPSRTLPAPAQPSCPSRHDAGTAGICLLQNTWPWHSPARPAAGAGSGGPGWPHSGVLVPPFPKPRQALGQAGQGRAQVAVAEDTRGDTSPWSAQGPSGPQLVFAAMLCSCPVPARTPGAPLVP